MSEFDNTVFFISPIGGRVTEAREEADKVLNHIVRPAVEELGYHVLRADEYRVAGIITDHIREHLDASPVVIADLSGHNANVCIEVGYRIKTGKPHIQIIKEGEGLPFDVANERTVQYSFDIEVANQAIMNLRAMVANLNGTPSDGPSPVPTRPGPMENADNVLAIHPGNMPIVRPGASCPHLAPEYTGDGYRAVTAFAGMPVQEAIPNNDMLNPEIRVGHHGNGSIQCTYCSDQYGHGPIREMSDERMAKSLAAYCTDSDPDRPNEVLMKFWSDHQLLHDNSFGRPRGPIRRR